MPARSGSPGPPLGRGVDPVERAGMPGGRKVSPNLDSLVYKKKEGKEDSQSGCLFSRDQDLKV